MRIRLVFLALVVISSSLEAQPTIAECREQAVALKLRVPWGRGWERISQCDSLGSAAIAEAITNAYWISDSTFLQPLFANAVGFQTPAIFDAALGVTRNSVATVASRMMSIHIVLSHYEPGGSFGLQYGWGDLIAWTEVPCQLLRISDFRATVVSPPSPAQLTIAAQTFENLARSDSTPDPVRRFARCARRQLERAIPIVPNTTPEFLSVEYICGTRFRVINRNNVWLAVTWRVEATTDSGGMSIPPSGEREFRTTRGGRLELLYDGHVVAARNNDGKNCPL